MFTPLLSAETLDIEQTNGKTNVSISADIFDDGTVDQSYLITTPLITREKFELYGGLSVNCSECGQVSFLPINQSGSGDFEEELVDYYDEPSPPLQWTGELGAHIALNEVHSLNVAFALTNSRLLVSDSPDLMTTKLSHTFDNQNNMTVKSSIRYSSSIGTDKGDYEYCDEESFDENYCVDEFVDGVYFDEDAGTNEVNKLTLDHSLSTSSFSETWENSLDLSLSWGFDFVPNDVALFSDLSVQTMLGHSFLGSLSFDGQYSDLTNYAAELSYGNTLTLLPISVLSISTIGQIENYGENEIAFLEESTLSFQQAILSYERFNASFNASSLFSRSATLRDLGEYMITATVETSLSFFWNEQHLTSFTTIHSQELNQIIQTHEASISHQVSGNALSANVAFNANFENQALLYSTLTTGLDFLGELLSFSSNASLSHQWNTSALEDPDNDFFDEEYFEDEELDGEETDETDEESDDEYYDNLEDGYNLLIELEADVNFDWFNRVSSQLQLIAEASFSEQANPLLSFSVSAEFAY